VARAPEQYVNVSRDTMNSCIEVAFCRMTSIYDKGQHNKGQHNKEQHNKGQGTKQQGPRDNTTSLPVLNKNSNNIKSALSGS
jgi:hypothetical protein